MSATLRYGDPHVTKVTRVSDAIPDGMYRCAIVHSLSPDVHALVARLRDTVDVPAPMEHQLIPHLTILFIGRLARNVLLDLNQAVSRVQFLSVDVRFLGIEVFTTSSGLVNVHLRVSRASKLVANHHLALEVCERMRLTPETDYLRKRYSPHVTIFDRLPVQCGEWQAQSIALPKGPVSLTDVHMICRIVDN